MQHDYVVHRLRGGLQLLLVIFDQPHVHRDADVLQHVHRFGFLRGRLQLHLVDKPHLYGDADYLQHDHRFNSMRRGPQLLLVFLLEPDLHRNADRLQHPHDLERVLGRLQLHLEFHQCDVYGHRIALQFADASTVHDTDRLQLAVG